MSTWDQYSKEATRGTGEEYPSPPDDIYTCIVRDVSDPETGPDMYNPGKERTSFFVEWEIEDDLDDGDGGSTQGMTFRQYMALPATYLQFGSLNEKSTVFEVMKALGYDMDADSFHVNPEEWNGRKARVTTEQWTNDKGYVRVKVKSLAPVRKEREREPVGAGAGSNRRTGLRERLQD